MRTAGKDYTSLRFGAYAQESCVDLGDPSKEEVLTMGQLWWQLSVVGLVHYGFQWAVIARMWFKAKRSASPSSEKTEAAQPILLRK